MIKMLTKRLLGIVVIGLLCIILLDYGLRFSRGHMEMEKVSEDYFVQVHNLIEKNQKEMDVALEDFSNTSLRRAKLVSYVIEHYPDIESDIQELKKLAEIMEVDEIHLFDTSGKIYFGTHPEYYDFTFQSGKQMSYFLPMLEDYSMEMCQEITPNTAENKLMQYAAVWREDRKGIVQVGLVPERVLKIKEENSLNNIVSIIPSEKETELYIVSEGNGEILASTDTSGKYKSANELKVPWKKATSSISMVHENLTERKHCVFMQKHENLIYIRTYPSWLLVREIFLDTGFTTSYILLLFVVLLVLLRNYANSKIIKGLNRINKDMKEIEDGTKYHVSDIPQIPELSELSASINVMTDSIRSAFRNFSIAIENSNIQMGIYEYSNSNKRYFVSERVWEILKIEKSGDRNKDQSALSSRVRALKNFPYDLEKHIYTLQMENDVYYVHIEEFEYEHHKILLFVDTTDEYQEKEKIIMERDRDYLTNLYTRRAFIEQLRKLFQAEASLKHAAILMIDADGLKQVNDGNGHQAGDQYLKEISALLLRESGKNSICARLGGDEFAVLLYGYSSEEALLHTIQNIKSKDACHYMTLAEEKKIPLLYSVGYAIYKRDADDYHTLLKCADERMYSMKEKRHLEQYQEKNKRERD